MKYKILHIIQLLAYQLILSFPKKVRSSFVIDTNNFAFTKTKVELNTNPLNSFAFHSLVIIFILIRCLSYFDLGKALVDPIPWGFSPGYRMLSVEHNLFASNSNLIMGTSILVLLSASLIYSRLVKVEKININSNNKLVAINKLSCATW